MLAILGAVIAAKQFVVRVPPGLRLSWTPRGLRPSRLPVAAEPLPDALAAALPARQGSTTPVRQGRLTPAERAAEEVEALRRRHLSPVDCVDRPVIPLASSASAADLLPGLERSLLTGIPGLARRRRRAAREQAVQRATEEAERLAADARMRRVADQAACDAWWSRLADGDPAAVFSFCVEAFDRAGVSAALVAVDGHDLTLVTTVPGLEALPPRMPIRGSKGKATTRTMLRGERAELYTALVCGHAVLTLREAFALLPFASTLRLVVLLDSGVGALGLRRLEPLLCVVSPRATFLRSVRPESSAADTLRAGCRDVLQNVQAGQLVPIPLDHQDGLKDLLHAIDRV